MATLWLYVGIFIGGSVLIMVVSAVFLSSRRDKMALEFFPTPPLNIEMEV